MIAALEDEITARIINSIKTLTNSLARMKVIAALEDEIIARTGPEGAKPVVDEVLPPLPALSLKMAPSPGTNLCQTFLGKTRIVISQVDSGYFKGRCRVL